MNQINPRKLLHSKWTTVTPKNKEKHFLVVEVDYDDEGSVTLYMLEAVINHRQIGVNWHDLKNSDHWKQGWK
ncbi:TIGR02450 family Trp-rich protein [Litorivicinus sp.]|nr:TIGR02450 family Trp-rich protein [Litorivicinus sp.]